MSAKYFIGIIMPDEILRHVESIKQQLFAEYGLKGALRSPAHITLHRPFMWEERKESELLETLSEFTFEGNFQVELKDFNFFEPRVIYIDVISNPQLEELHSHLTRHARTNLRLFNEAGDMRGFHPHVTVAFRDLKKPLFYSIKPLFVHRSFSAAFQCNGFSLLKHDGRWNERMFFPFRTG
jgi:2'-5' RNA ligase